MLFGKKLLAKKLWTNLKDAASRGDTQTVYKLVLRIKRTWKTMAIFDMHRGLNANAKTPLDIALERGHRDIANILISNKVGLDPRQLSRIMAHGNHEFIDTVLQTGMNIPSNAIASSNGRTVEHLHQRGVDVFVSGRNHRTPLQSVSGASLNRILGQHGLHRVLKAPGMTAHSRKTLIAHMARTYPNLLRSRVRVLDHSGETPLHIAARTGGDYFTVKHLLNFNGNKLATDRHGQIPYEVATNTMVRRLLHPGQQYLNARNQRIASLANNRNVVRNATTRRLPRPGQRQHNRRHTEPERIVTLSTNLNVIDPITTNMVPIEKAFVIRQDLTNKVYHVYNRATLMTILRGTGLSPMTRTPFRIRDIVPLKNILSEANMEKYVMMTKGYTN